MRAQETLGHQQVPGLSNPTEADESLYREGQRDAEAQFGAETRDFDRVLAGLAKVFSARGIPADLHFADRYWHAPTAGFPADKPFADLLKEMEWQFRGTTDRKHYDPFDLKRSTINWTSGTYGLPTVQTIEGDADSLLASEIKRAFPKVRRGTARYKELWAKHREDARKLVAPDLARKLEEKADSLERELASTREYSFGSRLRESLWHADWIEQRAKQLEALGSTDTEIAKAMAQATQIRTDVQQEESVFRATATDLRARATKIRAAVGL